VAFGLPQRASIDRHEKNVGVFVMPWRVNAFDTFFAFSQPHDLVVPERKAVP
jgi:hypothetical protein